MLKACLHHTSYGSLILCDEQYHYLEDLRHQVLVIILFIWNSTQIMETFETLHQFRAKISDIGLLRAKTFRLTLVPFKNNLNSTQLWSLWKVSMCFQLSLWIHKVVLIDLHKSSMSQEFLF